MIDSRHAGTEITHEIEITPEMVEAGNLVLSFQDEVVLALPYTLTEDVYRAMELARRSKYALPQLDTQADSR